MSKPARRDGTPERNEHNRDVESYISNARPARHQHVADRKPPKKAGGQGNQKKRTKSDNEKTRLQKVLAAAGVASRRMSE
ncbi:MAG: rRNA pseudouridine synthase, partial [Corynebacterium variabile]|nr:rRNA pseudouridine synthase [Corynebacterium variabile]